MTLPIRAGSRVVLVQPWTPTPETWRSMTRYAERIAMMAEPELELTFASASHLNVPRPLRRFRYARFDPLPRRWPEAVDLVHFTDVYLGVHARRFNAARVTTLHDLIPFEYANWRPLSEARWRIAYLRSLRALGRSDVVITPSEFTRKQLLERRPLAPERVIAVPIPVPADLVPPPQGAARDGNVILSIGTTAAYKNLPCLLHALARPELKHARLVRVGSPFDFELPALAARLGIEDRITHMGPVSDEMLLSLLQSSTVLAQPSLTEGFGMPVAEAMATGLPVVASAGGSLPEVLGDAGLTVPLRAGKFEAVNEDDAKDLAAGLARVIESPALQAAYSAAGLARAQRYRMDAVREQLFAAYGAAVGFAKARTGA